MTAKEQKAIFTFAVLFMFGGFMSAVLFCPPPLDGERPLIFALGVAEVLIPSFALLALARKLSEVR